MGFKRFSPLDDRKERLYAGIEAGVLELDDTLQRRVQQAMGAREALLIEMTDIRRRQALPVDHILPSRVQTFSKVIRAEIARPQFHICARLFADRWRSSGDPGQDGDHIRQQYEINAGGSG